MRGSYFSVELLTIPTQGATNINVFLLGVKKYLKWLFYGNVKQILILAIAPLKIWVEISKLTSVASEHWALGVGAVEKQAYNLTN